VQHYGYEFKYGTNDVDINAKMGDFPPFCDGILPKMEQLVRGFRIDKDAAEDPKKHPEA